MGYDPGARPWAYYNEIDEGAAEWLRELIKAGEITDGEVDTRSIRDVAPVDVRGFAECHFFAGIGVWSRAKRDARVDHGDRVVWTASCPCQPFSVAGSSAGVNDERHLWPDLHWLIRQCRPDRVYGEQVASKDGLAWLDLVLTDLEGEGYAAGAVDSCAAGYGAPHVRQRLYWVADANDAGLEIGRDGSDQFVDTQGRRKQGVPAGLCSVSDRMVDADGGGRAAGRDGLEAAGHRSAVDAAGRADGVADANGRYAGAERQQRGRQLGLYKSGSGTDGLANTEGRGLGKLRSTSGETGQSDIGGQADRPGPVNGFWRRADWLFSRDGYWRPVEAGTFPLANGIAGRVGLLRGSGNAIVLPQAQVFIEEAHLACEDMRKEMRHGV